MKLFLVQDPDRLTTAHGAPVGDKLNSLSVGPRGPLLLQDHVLIEELAHFDRERIPERVVHAKGAGAFGYFEVRLRTYQSVSCNCSKRLKNSLKFHLFLFFLA